MAKSKFLVLHPKTDDVPGLVSKINGQNQKNGPFEAVILLGEALEVSPDIPTLDVPVYYNAPSAEDSALPANWIRCSKDWTSFKLPSGASMGFLAHNADDNVEVHPVDILVTFQWSSSIARTQNMTLVSSKSVDVVARAAQPMYHFCAGTDVGKFHEHPVFLWNKQRFGRFISLGRQGSTERWFYAFGLDVEHLTVPDKVFTNPYEVAHHAPPEETASAEDEAPGSKRLQLIHEDASQSKRAKVVAPSECFFCLSNPKLETHMIVAISQQSYMTIAKGPLPLPEKLGFSGHAIIIPIEHVPQVESVEARDDISKFEDSLSKMYQPLGYVLVSFEICKPDSVHFHVQCIAVPEENALDTFERALTDREGTNNSRAHNAKLTFHKFTNVEDLAEAREVLATKEYVQFRVHTGDGIVSFVSGIGSGESLDLQFPRRVLAFHLRLPKRVRWIRCTQTVAQETDECEKFKAAFQKVDFTKKD